MTATRWAQVFACAAILLFAGILVRLYFLAGQVNYQPCDNIPVAGTIVTDASAPSVVGIFPNNIWLGSPLCVAIKGPVNVAVDKDGKPTPLHLFLDGLELKNAVGTVVNRDKNLVVFDVTRSADDAAVWSKIIDQLQWGKWGAGASVHVNAGTDAGEFADGNQKPLELMMVDSVSLILGVATFLAAVLALVFVAKVSSILRDGNAGSSYSLARVQMAFWLYLITAAFVFIWLVTGDYNGVLTSQALTLMGISSATALMAISVNKPAAQAAPAASAGFLTDILSDSNGVALHRLQIAVWTLVLGVVFFAEIYHSFRLPTFDSNLLVLMGLSGVTYVGFKFQES